MIEDPNEFERELRAALRRESPPADFAAKVLAKVPAKPAVIAMPRRKVNRALIAAIAATITCAAIIPPAISEYHRRQEARALEASRQLIVALNITRAKLRQTRERIQRNTRHTL